MKLPRSWSEVTIDTFLKYYTISQSKVKDLIDYEIELLSIFSGLSTTEVSKLKGKDIIKYSKQLGFLKTLPSQKITPLFKIDGKVYKPCLLTQDMIGLQFMNFTEILKNNKDTDYIYQMPYLIASMSQVRERGLFIEGGKVSLTRYAVDDYNKVGDLFRDKLTMDKAYPLFVFFCAVMERLYPAIQDYLTNELVKVNPKLKKEIKQLIKDLQPTGAGSL